MNETADVVKLLAGAAGTDADLRLAIGTVGPERTAGLLAAEVVYRARLDGLAPRTSATVRITLQFRYPTGALARTVSVGPEGVVLHDRREQDWAEVVVSQDLTEVVRALYGPREYVSGASQVVHWPGSDVVAPGGKRYEELPVGYFPVVQRVLRSLERREPVDLAELAAECGTDKWSALHRYPEHYDRHFGPLRENRLTVLEIGVGGYAESDVGAESLRMWKHYFPRAVVYGLDIEDKSRFDEPRIVTVPGDQSDSASLEKLARELGPFDIIIDDGSHISEHVITTFRALFDHLRPDGLYVIEDLHTSYWKPQFRGNDRDLADPRFTVGFLKTLLDGLHHEDFLRPDAREPQTTDRQVKGVHFYHNLCFLEKGPNVEGSPLTDVLRSWYPEEVS